MPSSAAVSISIVDALGRDGRPLLTVLRDVAKERGRQDAQWGGPAHDDTLTPGQWSATIDRLNHNAGWLALDPDGVDDADIRRRWIQVAAVAVAAVEALDRRTGAAVSNGE